MQRAVQQRAKAFDVVCAAPPLETFQLQRGSVALRSESHPSGIPTLGHDRQKQVARANELLHFTASIQSAAPGHRAAYVLEAPSSTYIWQQPAVKALLTMPLACGI